MAKKDKERIANRLAAISSAAPQVNDARIPEPKKRGSPQRAARDPVFRPGKLYLSKSHHLRCVIRNVSATGAYIHMEGVHTLPQIVVLRFEQTGIVKKARVVWQNETEVGLAYLTEPVAGDDKNAASDAPPITRP